MLAVTERAKEELKRMLSAKADNPQAGLRLTPSSPNKFALGIDTEMSGDQVVMHEGLKVLLAKKNKKLIRTKVGEPSIVEQLNQHNLKLGGEPSGHILMTDYLGSSDAIYIALRLLEIIIKTDNWKLETFDHYPQINLTVPVSIKKPLNQQPFSNIIESTQNMLPNGRLIVRYSGTESLLRITAEDQDKKHAYQIAQNVAEKLKQALS